MTSTFAETAAIYEFAQRLQVQKSLISHGLFMRYYHQVKELRRRLKDSALTDEYTRTLLDRLWGVSYHLSGLPLPFGFPGVCPVDLSVDLRRLLVRVSFPSADDCDLAADAIKLLEDLTMLGSNPISNELSKRAGSGEVAILIAKTKYLSDVKEYFSGRYPEVRVLTQYSLRKTRPFERLFLLGSPSWYPDHVFTAPRCSQIHVICYDWHYQSKKPRPLFELSPQPEAPASSGKQSWATPTWTGGWREAVSRFAQTDGEERYEDVSAKLFLLEGENAVLLEDAETAKVYVVDPDGSELEAEETTVDRVRVYDIDPGMFVLLRVGGGGDYIVEVADELMGAESTRRREKQIEWKGRLRNLIWRDGMDSVVNALLEAGCSKANYTNVRNWAGQRNIRTNSKDDFAAIMSVLGLDDRTDEYWDNARQIRRAHNRAGNEIKRRLLERVADADVSSLDESGYMEFELPIEGRETGKLAAFRILSISSETFEVAYNKTGQLFPLVNDQWPA